MKSVAGALMSVPLSRISMTAAIVACMLAPACGIATEFPVKAPTAPAAKKGPPGIDSKVKRQGGRTPLMDAARGGDVRAVELLIDNGSDVNAKD